jgi:multidrug efflux pump subunit AcrA (membrane-fusion protein)
MKRLVIILGTALLGFLGYTLYGGTQRVQVKTVPVTRGDVRLTVSTVFIGSVVPDREATLSFQTSGQLRSLEVLEGGTAAVVEGLAHLDDIEAKAQVMLAQANLQAV